MLRYNPWHSLPEHQPLGNSNRARRRMYRELAMLRQGMNQVSHVEPTGDETCEPTASEHRRPARGGERSERGGEPNENLPDGGGPA